MLVMGPVSYNQIQQLFQPLEYIHRKYQNRIVQRINDSLEHSYQGVEKLFELARQRHFGAVGTVDKIYLQNIMKVQQQIDVIHYQLLLSFKEFARDAQVSQLNKLDDRTNKETSQIQDRQMKKLRKNYAMSVIERTSSSKSFGQKIDHIQQVVKDEDCSDLTFAPERENPLNLKRRKIPQSYV